MMNPKLIAHGLTMVDVALFPIPNSVNFPGVPCPLHVFEPRYRQMVHHCIDQNLLMGVCHTEKMLHHKEQEQTVAEALASNQATYKPQRIFSAGPVQLLQELDDGRILIQVDNNVRLQLGQEKQTLPFSIWACEELLDESLDETGELTLQQSQAKILNRLLAITHDNKQAQEMLNSGHWQTMPAHAFSFAAAGLLGMAPETSQALLEMTNAQNRLDTILEMINAIGSTLS
ncbi:MAG: LON peptidase substrate-binding domain-containing protein [Halioglobus sp.]